MKTYENHCCGCATPNYPCRGKSCELRRVPVMKCDNCGTEIEDTIDGEELCEECAKRYE